MCHFHIVERGTALIDDAADHAFHVVAGTLRHRDNLGQRFMARFGQCPHGGRAHAGAAVSQHGLGQLGHHLAE
jgi:hypothetical protein